MYVTHNPNTMSAEEGAASKSHDNNGNTDEEPVPFVCEAKSREFRLLRVPVKVPLKYEYEWMKDRLFNKDGTPIRHAGLANHAHKWFEELRVHMKCLETFIDKYKGSSFIDVTDQFMYGSLLETMRDLLAKLMRATCGPGRGYAQQMKIMDDRLAPFLKGIDGSGIE